MTSGNSELDRFLTTLPRVVEQFDKAVTPYLEQFDKAVTPYLEQFDKAVTPYLEQFDKAVTTFIEAVTPYVEPVLRALPAMAEKQRISNLMVEAGWLYHQTTPLDLFADPEVGAKEVCDKLNEYYKENWISLRVAIESQFNDYDVDDEAKATVREAIDAHGYGLYRSVCRLLFPEIDRVFRTEILGQTTGWVSYKNFIESRSLHELLPGGWYDLDYLSHLMMPLKGSSDSVLADKIFGLFRHVEESDLPRLDRDPVPNRHAAMHGFVSYSSPQNSLNAIFIADYIFRLVSSLKNAATDRGG